VPLPLPNARIERGRYETYDVRLKDLSSGAELDETIKDIAGSIAWAGDRTELDLT
jgi:protease II